MRVIQLISTEGYYGAESMLVTLAEAHQRIGIRTSIAVFEDTRVSPRASISTKAGERGIATHAIPCSSRWDITTVRCIRRLLMEERPDILHCHGYKADLYGFAAARGLGIALVSTCHSWPDRRVIMRAYAAADRLILRWFDQVTTPSSEVAAILHRSGVKRAKVTVVANGVDVERFQGAEPTLRHELPGVLKHLIGSVARLVPVKGGAVLLQAAKQILSVCPETAFVFAGEGTSRRDWQTLAEQLGIAERVFFVGARSDMAAVYASLDVLALPSFAEAMPMCLLEALSAGCPVVATNVGDVANVIRPGVTGLLIRPGDVAALTDAILEIILNPSAAAQRVKEGRALVASTYSATVMVHNYSTIYERALSTRARTLVPAADGADSA
jgi:glycosyltransferase involved in cell wall biosynthesis